MSRPIRLPRFGPGVSVSLPTFGGLAGGVLAWGVVAKALQDGDLVKAVVVAVCGLIGCGFCLLLGAWGTAQVFIAEQARSRMRVFAKANGFRYERVSKRLPGGRPLLFDVNKGGMLRDAFSGTMHGMRFRTGNVLRRQTSAELPTPWGFVSFTVPKVDLPHLFLDARANNLVRKRGLGAHFSKHQVYELEGDFPTSFTLYCPPGFETRALYIFTPDVMATLVDEASTLDVEIVRGRVFLYRRGFFEFHDGREWERIDRFAATVVSRLARRMEAYADSDDGTRELSRLRGSNGRRGLGASQRGLLKGPRRRRGLTLPTGALFVLPLTLLYIVPMCAVLMGWW